MILIFSSLTVFLLILVSFTVRQYMIRTIVKETAKNMASTSDKGVLYHLSTKHNIDIGEVKYMFNHINAFIFIAGFAIIAFLFAINPYIQHKNLEVIGHELNIKN